MSTTPPAGTAASSDVQARPLSGMVVEVIALLLTASPILAVAVWSMLAWV